MERTRIGGEKAGFHVEKVIGGFIVTSWGPEKGHEKRVLTSADQLSEYALTWGRAHND